MNNLQMRAMHAARQHAALLTPAQLKQLAVQVLFKAYALNTARETETLTYAERAALVTLMGALQLAEITIND